MSPNLISVIGGGRWARVIAGVLNDFLPRDASIAMYSPKNAEGLRTWCVKKCLERIDVYDLHPDFDKEPRPDAVIVANAARDHLAAVPALLAGIPTLVEKPLAVTADDAGFLVSVAQSAGCVLCVSNIVQFTRYVGNFADMVSRCGDLKSIRIVWADPVGEHRYGDKKQYDTSLSVIQDVFPHVVSLLRVLSAAPIRFMGVELHKGGAKVLLDLRLGEITCKIELQRNAAKRKRKIEVKTDTHPVVMDFATEPGHIVFEGNQKNGDALWDHAPRPIHAMLGSFIESAVTRTITDKRLSPQLALEAARIIDLAAKGYRTELVRWMSAHYHDRHDQDFRYALTEILSG